MARFTAGERRGLFVLIIVLGLLTLYLVVRNDLALQQTVTPPSVCSVDTIAVSDTVSAGRKADSAAVKPSRRKKVSPRRTEGPLRRSPLDDGVN